MKKHGLNVKNAIRGDCKLPQGFIARKSHSIWFDISEAGLSEVLFYYETNRKNAKLYINLNISKHLFDCWLHLAW